jgi:hypothetical protein
MTVLRLTTIASNRHAARDHFRLSQSYAHRLFHHRHPAALGPCSYSWPDFSIFTVAFGEPEELP